MTRQAEDFARRLRAPLQAAGGARRRALHLRRGGIAPGRGVQEARRVDSVAAQLILEQCFDELPMSCLTRKGSASSSRPSCRPPHRADERDGRPLHRRRVARRAPAPDARHDRARSDSSTSRSTATTTRQRGLKHDAEAHRDPVRRRRPRRSAGRRRALHRPHDARRDERAVRLRPAGEHLARRARRPRRARSCRSARSTSARSVDVPAGMRLR